MALDRFIKSAEVRRTVGLQRTVIYKRVREGSFPPPIKLGARLNVWRESDIREWMDSQAAARDEQRVAP